jgi:hypothetical protein
MTTPTLATVKRLFARCRNQCAHPDCTLPIIEDSDTVTGDICHIKAASPGGPRYDLAQAEAARHDAKNLILLCTRHHRIVDADERTYTVDVLTKMKQAHEQAGMLEITPQTTRAAERLLANYASVVVHGNSGQIAVNSPGAMQANTLNVNVTKKMVTIAAPQGSIGSDQAMMSYLTYLIQRYQDYQKADRSKDDSLKYMLIHNALKREFKGNWKLLAVARFDDVAAFLQGRIDRTRVGKLNTSKRKPNYHSFAEHL